MLDNETATSGIYYLVKQTEVAIHEQDHATGPDTRYKKAGRVGLYTMSDLYRLPRYINNNK